jgi:hypothetical protein
MLNGIAAAAKHIYDKCGQSFHCSLGRIRPLIKTAVLPRVEVSVVQHSSRVEQGQTIYVIGGQTTDQRLFCAYLLPDGKVVTASISRRAVSFASTT